MNHHEVTGWQKDASIAAIVRATFPEYKRKKVYVYSRDSVTLTDLNWSGGTRSEYRTCTLAGEAIGSTEKYAQLAPWNNFAEGKTIPIPPGFVVVRGGHFLGKPSILSLYINPSNLLAGPEQILIK